MAQALLQNLRHTTVISPSSSLSLTQYRRRSTNIQLPTTRGHTTYHNTTMHDNEMTLSASGGPRRRQLDQGRR